MKIFREVLMKRKTLITASMFLLLLGLGSLTHGAGFLIYEHGAAAMAMGGAFVAVANDPTAIFHNPAGIAWLDGTQISLGSTLITSKSSLELPNWPTETTWNVKSQLFYPSTFYITHKFTERIVGGFGFFSPYGLGTTWENPETFPLRYLATSDEMKTFVFNPTVAFKIADNVALAVGVSYIMSDLTFELVDSADLRPYGGSIYDVPASVTGDGNTWGYNAGFLYKGEKASLGVNWRSGFKIDFEGDLDLDPSNVPAPLQALIPPSGDVRTTFNFPHILAFGAAFNLTEKTMLSLDFHYLFWNTYDEFTIAVDYPDPYPDSEQVVEENWEVSVVFRGGFQYQLNEKLALRAGFLYDQTPQPVTTMDPILPDANRIAFTGGFGFKTGNLFIDVGYQFEMFSDRTSPNRSIAAYQIGGVNLGEGTYSTTAHLIGVSFGFKL